MKAAILQAPGTFRLEEVAMPRPSSRQVRVRIEGCGVCGSNAPLWEGRPWFTYPLAPGQGGHEAWGVVDELGAEVTGLAPGQRVAALFGNAFAEYDVCDAASVVPLPRALEGKPFPGEAIGCALNVFRRAEIRAGQDVAVVGVGFLGAIVCRMAALAGARVIAISRRPFALGIAKSWGAQACIPMDDHGRIIETVQRLTDGKLCERVVEAVGLQWPLDLATAITAERGRLVIAGYHQDGPRNVDMQTWNWRGLDVINAHERDPKVYVEGMRAALDAVASGALDPSPLYTDVVPLERIGDAFEAQAARRPGFLKALVSCS